MDLRNLDSFPLGIYRTTVEGRLVSANAAALQILGARRLEEVYGQPVSHFYADADDRSRLVDRLRREGRVAGLRVRLRRPDGTPFWAEIHATLVRERDEPAFIDGIIEDVTRLVAAENERRLAESALRRSEERYRAFLSQTSEGIWRFELEQPVPVELPDDEQIELYYRHAFLAECNPAMARMYGFGEPGELLGARLETLLVRDDPQNLDMLRRFVRQGHRLLEAVSHERDKEGRAKYFVNNFVGIIEAGALTQAWGVQRDITESLAAERALRESEERYRLMADNSTDLISRQTPEGVFLYASPAALTLLGCSPDSLLGQSAFERIEREDLELARRAHQAALTGIASRASFRARRDDGTPVWIETTTRAVPRGDTPERELVSVWRDVSERKRVEDEIAYQAYHDVLTGLPNRALFADRLFQALAQARRRARRLAVLLLDLDHFKRINDTLGHTLGDRLLQEVAGRLVAVLRDGDTVARVGGDEFMLLLDDVGGAEAAAKVAQKLLEAVARPIEVMGHRLYVTASIGIGLHPADGRDVETLLKSADSAMYRAKDAGRNSYQLCAPALTARAMERLSLETSLRQALERGEFVVHYQPVLELATRRVSGAEALVRWVRPDGQLVPPAHFVPVAEETGLIVPIGDWVLREACRQARLWRDAGLPAMRVAVNLSAHQLRQKNLLAALEEALGESGLDPSGLQLEITESSAMQDVERSVELLRALRASGIGVLVDDFGTGYSSLSYLKRFPIDAVKVDQAFVRDITSDPGDAAIVSAIVAMAHSLGLRVIAEGVETEAQLEFLAERGCDEMQGYLFGEALPAPEFDALLSGSRAGAAGPGHASGRAAPAERPERTARPARKAAAGGKRPGRSSRARRARRR